MNPQVALMITALGVGSITTLAIYMLLQYWFSDERKVEKRLEGIMEFADTELAEAEPLALPFAQRIIEPVREQLIAGARSLTPNDYLTRLRARLISAGKLDTVSPEQIIITRAGFAAAGLGLGVLGSLIYGLGVGQALIIGVILAAGLSYLPDRRINTWATERRAKIVRELPDMLDMLMISVQAGLGFDQAVARYISYASGPLSDEFSKALQEIQAGKTRREAFRALGDRAGEPALRAFVMAIVQADVFGVSVAEVLRAQSYELRTKRRQLAEEEAQKAPVKMTIPLMGCILPTTVLVVVVPVAVSLLEVFSNM